MKKRRTATFFRMVYTVLVYAINIFTFYNIIHRAWGCSRAWYLVNVII